MKIIVLGKEIPIVFTQNLTVENEEANGAYSFDFKCIEVNAEVTDRDKIINIIAHEAGHALLDRLGLNGRLDHDLEEVIVESFKNLFLDNDFKNLYLDE